MKKEYRVRETESHKRIYLIDTKYNMMVFVYNKADSDMDNVKIITLGDSEHEPIKNIIYRWEDPDFVSQVETNFQITNK